MKFPIVILSRKRLEFEISKQAMNSCENIIAEMGAELHDDLIQKLSLLRLHLDRLERSSFDPSETQLTIARMQMDFDHVTHAIRRISRRLHPTKMQDDSFDLTIQSLCQNMESPGILRVHFESTGVPQEISQQAEVYLGRMVQELIHNAQKHSSAWHVWVRIKWENSSVRIEVEDDGSGFSRIDDFIETLKKKYNTLRMRALAIGARIRYEHGSKGLLASILYDTSKLNK